MCNDPTAARRLSSKLEEASRLSHSYSSILVLPRSLATFSLSLFFPFFSFLLNILGISSSLLLFSYILSFTKHVEAIIPPYTPKRWLVLLDWTKPRTRGVSEESLIRLITMEAFGPRT